MGAYCGCFAHASLSYRHELHSSLPTQIKKDITLVECICCRNLYRHVQELRFWLKRKWRNMPYCGRSPVCFEQVVLP
jgi:hypothetical protein